MHAERESLEAFYLRLTGQAALCDWMTDQEKEVVRDIFIVKMRYKDTQRELWIRPGATPEKTLKSALLQEKAAQTASSQQNNPGIRHCRAASLIKGPSQPRVSILSRNRRTQCKGKAI